MAKSRENSPAEALRPERWSAKQRSDIIPRLLRGEDGWCWFFGAIDYFSRDIVGWHVAKKGDRWAALEPIRQGSRQHLGGYVRTIALGRGRHDWGP